MAARTRVKYKTSRPAEKLETILYQCPQCKEEYSMYSHNAHLTCNLCGYDVEVDPYGFLQENGAPARFDTPVKWENWEMENNRVFFIRLRFVLKIRCKCRSLCPMAVVLAKLLARTCA